MSSTENFGWLECRLPEAGHQTPARIIEMPEAVVFARGPSAETCRRKSIVLEFHPSTLSVDDLHRCAMGLHKLDATQSTDAGETGATSRNPGSSSQSRGYERDGDHDAPPSSDESSSTGDEDEEGWDDWGSDPEQKQPCPSLFDGTSLPSATEVLKHDKEKHGFDLEGTCKRLSES